MWKFFPAFYSVQPAIAKGLPKLTEVSLSSLSPGGPFDISVTGFNRGETTDIQIVFDFVSKYDWQYLFR
jgi:hypothetical protein